MLGLILTACSGDGTAPLNITGIVTEAGSETESAPLGTPLEGVTVTLGSNTVTTLQDGRFEFTAVAEGDHDVGAALNGYSDETVNVSASAGREIVVKLTPRGGRIHTIGALQDTLDELNGTETEDTIVTLSGSISNFALPSELATADSAKSPATAIQPSTTAITINKLQILVSGVVYSVELADDGSFHQTVPINPGPNTIQLRVFSSEGDAYTSSPIVVTVTFDQLDMRVLLRWDTTGWSDVDLHMFKRASTEANPTADSPGWWNHDRHVHYANKTPTDFGSGIQNPFLDIDDTEGFGPETVVLQDATSGDYHIWVHFYNQGADPVTNAAVEVTLNEPGGNMPTTKRFEKALTDDWEYWYVTTVRFPDRTFLDVPPAEAAAMNFSGLQVPAKPVD